MKKLYKVSAVAVMAAFAITAISLLPNASAAGTGTLTLSPSGGSYAKGSTFTVAVNENSGSSTVNAVQADLNYDKSELQFVSINADPPASDFGIKAAASGGNGNVTFQLGNITALSGSHPVGKVTFKVLVDGPGSSPVTFDTTSAMLTNDVPANDVWNGSPTGGTYTLKAAPVNPDPKPDPKPDPTPTKTISNDPSPTITPSPTQQKADPTEPVPVSKVSNTSGLYLVAIRVVDNKGHVLSGATVTLGTKTGKTDATGVASFEDIKAGVYKVSVKSGSVKGSATVTVDGTQSTNAVQQFEVKAKPGLNLPLYIGIGAGVIVILVGLALFKSGRMGKMPRFKGGSSASSGDAAGPVVTVGGMTTPSSTASVPKVEDNVLKPNVVAPVSGAQPAAPVAPTSDNTPTITTGAVISPTTPAAKS